MCRLQQSAPSGRLPVVGRSTSSNRKEHLEDSIVSLTRSDGIPMIRLFLVVLAIHLFSFQPSIGWEDSAELIVAGRVLAPMHPPGTPIPVLISHVAQLIPLGSAPMRLHLLQGVVAAALVVWIAGYVARRTSSIGGVAAGLLMGCALWPVAVRAEVYVFSLLLIFMMGALVERWWLAGRSARCSDHLLVGLALGWGSRAVRFSCLTFSLRCWWFSSTARIA